MLATKHGQRKHSCAVHTCTHQEVQQWPHEDCLYGRHSAPVVLIYRNNFKSVSFSQKQLELIWQNAVLVHTFWDPKCYSTKDLLIRTGTRMSAEKTEGLKSYSWNAPRTYNSVYVVCPPRRTSFIPSCLLNHPLKPSKVSRFVTWKCIPSPENCIPLRFSCHWICECTAISNPQSVITDACYVSGYQNNLSLLGRSWGLLWQAPYI